MIFPFKPNLWGIRSICKVYKKHLLNYRWIYACLSTLVILQCSSVDVGSFSIWPLDPSAVAEDAKAPTNKMERCKNRSLAEKCIFQKMFVRREKKFFAGVGVGGVTTTSDVCSPVGDVLSCRRRCRRCRCRCKSLEKSAKVISRVKPPSVAASPKFS